MPRVCCHKQHFEIFTFSAKASTSGKRDGFWHLILYTQHTAELAGCFMTDMNFKKYSTTLTKSDRQSNTNTEDKYYHSNHAMIYDHIYFYLHRTLRMIPHIPYFVERWMHWGGEYRGKDIERDHQKKLQLQIKMQWFSSNRQVAILPMASLADYPSIRPYPPTIEWVWRHCVNIEI